MPGHERLRFTRQGQPLNLRGWLLTHPILHDTAIVAGIEAVVEGTAQAWAWIISGKLQADIERMPLKEVERAWKRTDARGGRTILAL